MDTSVIFGSLKLARSIAEFSGLIETIGTKIDRLANAEFEAGFRALEQAAISSSEKDSLLREARYRFNKAISLEKEERLFLCHVGLAICHKELGDRSNFKISLLQSCEVRMVSLDPIEIDRLIFGVYFGVLYTAFTSSDPPKIQEISGPTRISKLNAEQKKIREYLSNIDT